MKREELIARLSKELHDAKWKYDCHPVRLLLSYDEMDEVISALTALQSEAGRVSVPREKLEHWLEYWNRGTNERAMDDALNFLMDEIEEVLSAAPAPAEPTRVWTCHYKGVTLAEKCERCDCLLAAFTSPIIGKPTAIFKRLRCDDAGGRQE